MSLSISNTLTLPIPPQVRLSLYFKHTHTPYPTSGETLSLSHTRYAHTHAHTHSFSQPGSLLCGVGKDRHGKSQVVLWNTSQVVLVTAQPTPASGEVTPTPASGEVTPLTQAHTDVSITTMRIAHFDEKRCSVCVPCICMYVCTVCVKHSVFVGVHNTKDPFSPSVL